MEFKKIAEELDVNSLNGQKENLSKQITDLSTKEEAEVQKAVNLIKQKYAVQKQKLADQINNIDKSVSQEAQNLKQNLDTLKKDQVQQQAKQAGITPPTPVTAKPAVAPMAGKAEPPIA